MKTNLFKIAMIVSVLTASCTKDPPIIIESGTIENLTWTLAEDGTLTISGNGTMRNMGFPSWNYPWYPHRDAITTVVIEDGVTSVGEEAFSNCSGLKYVVIPNSMTEIGDGTFNNCSSLTSVTIPASVISVGGWIFHGCTGLTTINVDAANSAYTSDYGVLFNKEKTLLIQYPAGKTGIYTIPGSVTEIEDYAFQNCSGLMAVTIPPSVKIIGMDAFSYCAGLTSIIIGNSVESVGDAAFAGCRNLTEVIIPNSVTTIGHYAFRDCTGLKKVTMPEGVTYIGSTAFRGCSNLTEITIPESVTYIGSEAFRDCSSLTTVNFNAVNCAAMIVAQRKMTEPSGYFYTFSGCDKLTAVHIGNGVKTIPDNAFGACFGLTSITIPASVESIGDNAFRSTGLTSVIIPNSVTSMGADAFTFTPWYNDQPDGLIYINHILYGYKGTMPDHTRIVVNEGTSVIAGWTFANCTGLTSVSIPGSVTSFGKIVFYGCTGLTEIINHATIPQRIESEVIHDSFGLIGEFYNVNKNTCVLRVPAASVEAYRTADGWKDFVHIVAIE